MRQHTVKTLLSILLVISTLSMFIYRQYLSDDPPPNNSNKFVTYKNEKYLYSIQYPQNSVLTNTSNIDDYTSNELNHAESIKIYFGSPDNITNPALIDGLLLNISFHTKSSNINLSDWYTSFNPEFFDTPNAKKEIIQLNTYNTLRISGTNTFLGTPSEILILEQNETNILIISASFSLKNERYYRSLYDQIVSSFLFY